MKQFILSYKDFLNEANRGNYYPNTKDQFYDFINKYKGQEDLIFISFKSSDKFVSKINIDYSFQTPQGLYTYPYKNYVENLIEDSKFLKIDVPFAGDKPFLYVYKLKSLDGFLTFQNKEDYPKALEILEKIKKDYGYSDEDIQNFLKNYGYKQQYSFGHGNPVSILYSFVILVISKGNVKIQWSVFSKYGIKGFIDNGGGFVHKQEKTQTDIFDVSIIEDYIIIDRSKDAINHRDFFNKIKDLNISVDDYKFLKFFEFYGLDFSKVDIDTTKNSIIYNGDVIFSSKEFQSIPKFLKYFTSIKGSLKILNCEYLQDVENLSNLEEIGTLEIEGCVSLKSFDGLYNLKNIDNVIFSNCTGLQNIDGFQNIELLEKLYFLGCKKLKTISGLKNIKSIKTLKINGCTYLQDVNFLENLKIVNFLNFDGLKKIKNIDGLKNTTNIEDLVFLDCKKIENITGLKNLKHAKTLSFLGCDNLKTIEGLPKNLEVERIYPKSFEDMFNQYKSF